MAYRRVIRVSVRLVPSTGPMGAPSLIKVHGPQLYGRIIETMITARKKKKTLDGEFGNQEIDDDRCT